MAAAGCNSPNCHAINILNSDWCKKSIFEKRSNKNTYRNTEKLISHSQELIEKLELWICCTYSLFLCRNAGSEKKKMDNMLIKRRESSYISVFIQGRELHRKRGRVRRWEIWNNENRIKGEEDLFQSLLEGYLYNGIIMPETPVLSMRITTSWIQEGKMLSRSTSVGFHGETQIFSPAPWDVWKWRMIHLHVFQLRWFDHVESGKHKKEYINKISDLNVIFFLCLSACCFFPVAPRVKMR